jgi:hypothetical protein
VGGAAAAVAAPGAVERGGGPLPAMFARGGRGGGRGGGRIERAPGGGPPLPGIPARD